jgi:hypothetical protein
MNSRSRRHTSRLQSLASALLVIVILVAIDRCSHSSSDQIEPIPIGSSIGIIEGGLIHSSGDGGGYD